MGSGAHDDYDEGLLDAAADDAATLLDVPFGELPTQARAVLRRVITARRPDGTWPPAELLHEVLRAHLDVVDERLRAAGPDESVPPGDRMWISAWRELVRNPTTFENLLLELRSEETSAGVPPIGPPPELRLLVEP